MIEKLNLKKNGFKKKEFQKKARDFFVDISVLLLACCIGSFGTVYIMIPNGLTSGGITGIARILQNFVDIEFSILYYVLAFTVFLLCLFLLGFKEARKIILLTVLYPAILFLFEQFDFRLLEKTDPLLAAIYCGVFSGISSGLILFRGYSSGGTDTMAKIIKMKWLNHVDLSKILLVIDAVIIIASGVVYGRNIALYALVTTYILTKVIDIIAFGLQAKIVRIEIISVKNDKIANYIMSELDRGVTFDPIVGAYTGNSSRRLVALCSPRESILIKQYVSRCDNRALMTIMKVDSIWGNGTGFGALDKE